MDEHMVATYRPDQMGQMESADGHDMDMDGSDQCMGLGSGPARSLYTPDLTHTQCTRLRGVTPSVVARAWLSALQCSL